MIPNQAIASADLPPADYLQPTLPPSSLIDYDWGPVALNTPGDGLSVKVWTFRVSGNEIVVGAADVPDDLLFNAEGVTAISGTFDQNGAPQVAFVQGGVAKYWWWDTIGGAYAITELPAGSLTPKMKLDDRRELQTTTNDVILSYILNNNLYFRAQRDRYTVEYLLKSNVGGTIQRCGMTTALRFGWDIQAGGVTGITFTTAMADSELGDTVSFAYQVSGGTPPYTFSIAAGALPTGLALNTTTGAVTGSFTVAGTFSYTVQVIDSLGVSAQLAEVVEVSVLGLAGNAPAGIVGAAYSYSYTATGGITPYTYSLTTGALPAGITLNTTSGVISGTPTAASSYSWRVQATDALGAVATVDDTAEFINALTITNVAPNIVANVAYSHTYTAAGGAGSNVWLQGGTLPAGITFNAGTATLSGTTTALGPYTFTVQVTDSASTVATLNESVTVSANVPFIITLANGTIIETTGATIQFRDRPGESVTLEDIE